MPASTTTQSSKKSPTEKVGLKYERVEVFTRLGGGVSEDPPGQGLRAQDSPVPG